MYQVSFDSGDFLTEEEREFIYNANHDKLTEEYLERHRYQILLNLQKKLDKNKYNEIIQKLFDSVLEKLGKKEKLKVAFFVFLDTTWSCHYLYSFFEQCERFEPYIIVVPTYEDQKIYDRVLDYYEQKKYNVLSYEQYVKENLEKANQGNLGDIVIRKIPTERGANMRI